MEMCITNRTEQHGHSQATLQVHKELQAQLVQLVQQDRKDRLA